MIAFFDTVILAGHVLLGIAILFGFTRMVKGPTIVDRILAFDSIVICVVGLVCLLSLKWQSAFFLELILIVAALGFFTTVALVFYLQKTGVSLRDEAKEGENLS